MDYDPDLDHTQSPFGRYQIEVTVSRPGLVDLKFV